MTVPSTVRSIAFLAFHPESSFISGCRAIVWEEIRNSSKTGKVSFDMVFIGF
jgi:hypothetical protein